MSKRKKAPETQFEQFRESGVETESRPVNQSTEFHRDNNMHGTIGTWSPFETLGMLFKSGHLSDMNDDIDNINADMLGGRSHFLP